VIRAREEQKSSVLVHYFSVDLEAERETVQGAPYQEEPFDDQDQARIVRLASDFDARFHRWLRQRQQNEPELFCRYPDDVLFSRGFFGKGFHAYFGFTNFAEVDTNIQRSLLYEFVREYVRGLSRLFPRRWWKFDYRVLFNDGQAYRRSTTTWETTPTDCPTSEETLAFLSS